VNSKQTQEAVILVVLVGHNTKGREFPLVVLRSCRQRCLFYLVPVTQIATVDLRLVEEALSHHGAPALYPPPLRLKGRVRL